ncbi:TM2 domain-containing protein [Marine Group III euryarchaeote]|nr:TM2 domain-containing protein [Marine Group III euryarchaeote]
MELSKQMDEKFCGDCGQAIKLKAEICPKCGVRQMGTNFGATSPSGKSKLAAVLFAFFLGGLGGHKFYLGQTGLGILYLVFFWTFIPALIALIEMIMLLVMSDEEFAEKY